MTLIDTSARTMIDFWTKIQKSDKRMNPGTVETLRRACSSVLEAYENWHKIDLRMLDVDEAIRKFRTVPTSKLAPSTHKKYERYFRIGIASYLEYLINPNTWQPPIPRRDSVSPREIDAPVSSSRSDLEDQPPRLYYFDLPSSRVSHLHLHLDLTLTETCSLLKFIFHDIQ
jgi:hypothetical protein